MARSSFQYTEREELVCEFRERFLIEIDVHAPEVLESLIDIVPIYNDLIGRAPSGGELASWLNGAAVLDPTDPQHTEIREELVRRFFNIRVNQSYVDPTQISAEKDRRWDVFLELRTRFTGFLETFGLEGEWLREEYWSYLVKTANGQQIQRTIAVRLDVPSLPVPKGSPLLIKIAGWQIDESWPEFEDRARDKFEQELKSMREPTMRRFDRLGHKRATKPPNFESVKWLVWWTVKRMSKEQILKRIDEANPDPDDFYELKSLEAAFRSLRTYGLPVRSGKKSMPQK